MIKLINHYSVALQSITSTISKMLKKFLPGMGYKSTLSKKEIHESFWKDLEVYAEMGI